MDFNNTGKVNGNCHCNVGKVMLILQGVCSDGKLHTVIWEENIHVGYDLVIFLIREGFVGGFGERGKFFVSEMKIDKY